MKLGILAHIFGKQPCADLAKTVAEHGFTSVQLALAKALSDIDSSSGKLSPGLANEVGEQFSRQGVKIAVLGCYINPVNPDAEERRIELNRFKEHIRYARDFGCSMVATETGSWATYKQTHPEDFEEKGWQVLRESVEELVEEGEKWGVNVAIEPVAVHTLHTTEHMQRLFQEVPSSNLGMLFDPCNLLKVHHIDDQETFLRQVFDTLYPHMIMIHAKDLVFNEDGSKQDMVAGEGLLNYPIFIELLKKYKPHIQISLEGVTKDRVMDSANFLRREWDKR
ncbi:sugar phosphate isomerase/epimerase [Paenibacillus sp. DS2015]|uniref:sugar phosphate isomerase/epimerase family protein n=1 Tax=Paenibacillus sp. DS2015 TaxID=3373917 RepID=UPI003D19DF6F